MISSLILSQTSFIIHAGVEAPAVMPTTSAWASRLQSQLLRPFDLLHAGTYLPADLSQTLVLELFPVADDHHVVAYRGQLMGFLLAF